MNLIYIPTGSGGLAPELFLECCIVAVSGHFVFAVAGMMSQCLVTRHTTCVAVKPFHGGGGDGSRSGGGSGGGD